MKYIITLYFILLTNILLSQNITLKYVGNSDEEIHMEYFLDNISVKQPVLKLNNKILSFKTTSNTTLFCNDIFRRTYIFAEPKDSIFFILDENRLIHYYSNTNKYRKTESDYINDCYSKYGASEIESSKKILNIVCQEFNLSKYIDTKYIKEQELLDEYYKNDKVSKPFYNYFKNIFWCITIHNSIDSDLKNAGLEIQKSYKRSNELLHLNQYRELIFNYNLKVYNKINPNPDLFTKLQFIYKKEYLPEIKNFLLYKSMANYIEENPDITKIDKKAVAFFKKNCKNSKYINLINKDLQPLFIPTIIDEIVKKNKGKLVLIDFWASWCAPCRTEFPSEKKLMEKHPEMAFIFFSIDDESKDWQKAMDSYPDMLNKNNYSSK
jgi:thiol-disulfide isomerase/thioredoxin